MERNIPAVAGVHGSLALSALIDDLSRLVLVIDPARASWDELREKARQECARLLDRIEAFRQEAVPQRANPRLEATLAAAAQDVSELSSALGDESGVERWRLLYGRLARRYEALVGCARELGELVSAPNAGRRISPTNYVRNAFHVAGGLTAALAYHFLLDRAGALLIMGLLAGTFTVLELFRRRSRRVNDVLMRVPFFRRIARPHEYYAVNSSTWYAWGILLAVVFFPRTAVELACLVLGFADPLASIVGRRVGGLKLFRDRSLAGSATFFGVAALVSLVFLGVLYPTMGLGLMLPLVFGVALAGTLAEVFSTKLDDNLTIPVASGLAAALVVWLPAMV